MCDDGSFGFGVIERQRPLDGRPGLVQPKHTASQRWQVCLVLIKSVVPPQRRTSARELPHGNNIGSPKYRCHLVYIGTGYIENLMLKNRSIASGCLDTGSNKYTLVPVL